MRNILTSTLIAAALLISIVIAPVRADESKGTVIRAQGNAYHINFVSAASKRGDLRLKIAKLGVDAAFTEWLKAEHPAAYKGGIAATLAKGGKTDMPVRFASSYCCKKDGGCCQSNC